jgi:glutathionylspermidine synthase
VITQKAEKKLYERAFEVFNMHLEGVDKVINDDLLMYEFGIPEPLWPAIKKSWAEKQMDFQGRFDFTWDLDSTKEP